jgi:uncharacterized protein (TIGR00255 family)
MTGFARTGGTEAAHVWQWELKSVNGKGLDLRVRLPSGFDRLDIPARERLGRVLMRGNVSATLEIRRTSEARSQPFQVNHAVLEAFLTLQQQLHGKVSPALPNLTDLLAVRGILEGPETETARPADTAEQDAHLLAGLEEAVSALQQARAAEGQRLSALLHSHLDQIAALTAEARAAASLQPQALSDKLRRQVAGLLADGVPVAEERLAQEIAILAAKADATEELDRLEAHVAAGRDLLTAGGAAGRKLDFLAQEFNREANTLVSKASELAVTRLGLELKTVIDQFREQVQNIE